MKWHRFSALTMAIILAAVLITPSVTAGDYTFTGRAPVPAGGYLSSVTFGAGLYVAVGGSGKIVTSDDARHWTARESGAGTVSLIGVAYGNGLFVAVGSKGTIVTSPDGYSWAKVSGVPSRNLFDITYGGGRFVVVGQGGVELTSRDGVTWTAPADDTTQPLFTVAYGGNRFVAAGEGGTITSSADGVTWDAYEYGVDNTLQFNSIVYGKGQFVLIGSTWTKPVGLRSENGVSWSRIDLGDDLAPEVLGFGNGKFVAVRSFRGSAMLSEDGGRWTSYRGAIAWESNLGGEVDVATDMVWGDKGFVLVGGNGAIYRSETGAEWTLANAAAVQSLSAVAYGNGMYVAGGAFETLMTSRDRTVWTAVTMPKAPGAGGFSYRSITGVAYGNNRFVLTTSNGDIYTSQNGTEWQQRVSGLGARLEGVTFGGGRFVAFGDGGIALVSGDGEGWSQSVMGTADQVRAVAYGAGTFLAVAGKDIFASADGVRWGRKASVDVNLADIVFGSNWFAAVSISDRRNGIYMISPDGQTVRQVYYSTEDYLDLYAIAAAGSRLMAVGEVGAVLTSDDGGLTWTRSNTDTDKTQWDLIYDGARFLSVGESGTIREAMPTRTYTIITHGIMGSVGTASKSSDPIYHVDARKVLEEGESQVANMEQNLIYFPGTFNHVVEAARDKELLPHLEVIENGVLPAQVESGTTATVMFLKYDWRLPPDKVADWYLGDLIERIQARDPSTRPVINVVAHSMGGLVVQSYLEQQYAANPHMEPPINTLMLVATPTWGSWNAYYIWHQGKAPPKGTFEYNQLLNAFAKETAKQEYFATHDVPAERAAFIASIPKESRIGDDMKESLWKGELESRFMAPEFLRTVINQYFPSLGWLRPLAEKPGMLPNNPPEGRPAELPATIEGLSDINTRQLSARVKRLQLFVGTGVETVWSSAGTSGDGDGTVPQASARADFPNNTLTLVKDWSHSSMMRPQAVMDAILALLDGTPNPPTYNEKKFQGTKDVVRKARYVFFSPVKPLFTDAQGRRSGFDPAAGTELDEIPGATWVKPLGGPLMVLFDQPEGEMQVSLLGTADGHFEVMGYSVDQAGQVSASTSVSGLIKIGETRAFQFTAEMSKVRPGAEPNRLKILLTVGLPEATVNDVRFGLDSAPYILNSRTMVPVRFISEAFGATVSWAESEQRVTIDLEGDRIVLWIGRGEAQVNGRTVPLDVAPEITNSRTMVPLRFISEQLRSTVEWIPDGQRILIVR